ncbi:hypothetical protein HRR86_008190 [Exophiala dermatitidis]|nr:hypothetical protein HRR82_009405 [Exophiala dermatitidis]KAJ4615244.1 hypothetical protein HRR86_008190 [Exophiala dermatitidis]
MFCMFCIALVWPSSHHGRTGASRHLPMIGCLGRGNPSVRPSDLGESQQTNDHGPSGSLVARSPEGHIDLNRRLPRHPTGTGGDTLSHCIRHSLPGLLAPARLALAIAPLCVERYPHPVLRRRPKDRDHPIAV